LQFNSQFGDSNRHFNGASAIAHLSFDQAAVQSPTGQWKNNLEEVVMTRTAALPILPAEPGFSGHLKDTFGCFRRWSVPPPSLMSSTDGKYHVAAA
jgi:hypothetical protein